MKYLYAAIVVSGPEIVYLFPTHLGLIAGVIVSGLGAYLYKNEAMRLGGRR